MDLLIPFIIFIVVYNRWWLFERFLKKTGMYILDMLLCTAAAAALVASPGPSLIFSYILAVFSAVIAFVSAQGLVLHLKNKKTPDAAVDD